MKNLILVKLGGSIITDKSKPYTARIDIIKKIAKKTSKFKNKNTDLIVGHGSGSFAHVPASKYQIHKGLINRKSVWGLALTADAAIQINRIVISEFLKLKIPCISFAPLSFNYGKKVLTDHIKKALEIGIVPIIYGDVILHKKRGFEIYSGEKTLDILALKLSKKYKKITIIYYTDTNGVYDDKGNTIPLITPKNFPEIKKYLQGSGNVDVTGGMIHKVEESLKVVQKLNAEIWIKNGFETKKTGTKISKFV